MREIIQIRDRQFVIVSEEGQRVILEALAGNFSDVRRVLGCEQKELAERLGISQGYLSKIETGAMRLPEAISRRAQSLLPVSIALF